MRRRLLSLSLALVLGLTVMPMALASPSAEAEFLAMTNASRSAAGLGPLTVDGALTGYARTHTASMIASGTIFHSTSAQLSSITTGWTRVGENVGMGPSVATIQQAFMNSAGHKANILGDFNYVGIGVDTAPSGSMFVTVIFMKKAGSPATTTTTVSAPTTTQAPAPAPAPAPTTPVPTPQPPASATPTTTTTSAAPTPPPTVPPAICGTVAVTGICLD